MKKQKSKWFALVSFLSEEDLKRILVKNRLISEFCYSSHIDELNSDGSICSPHIHAIICTKEPLFLSRVQDLFSSCYFAPERTSVFFAYCPSGEYSYLKDKGYKIYTSCNNFGAICRRGD